MKDSVPKNTNKIDTPAKKICSLKTQIWLTIGILGRMGHWCQGLSLLWVAKRYGGSAKKDTSGKHGFL